ncbi:hypothetical protein GTW43_22805 [Streptomyces sp. SID5785]|nr:hypothetical protein [Streptomyces sp. SID5785]
MRSSQEPARARAGEALHRAFALRDIARLVLGRYRNLRLSTPTVILAGAQDFMLPPGVLTGAGSHADDLRVQVVGGSGHYLHEERPDLVAETARGLFSRSRLPRPEDLREVRGSAGAGRDTPTAPGRPGR